MANTPHADAGTPTLRVRFGMPLPRPVMAVRQHTQSMVELTKKSRASVGKVYPADCTLPCAVITLRGAANHARPRARILASVGSMIRAARSLRPLVGIPFATPGPSRAHWTWGPPRLRTSPSPAVAMTRDLDPRLKSHSARMPVRRQGRRLWSALRALPLAPSPPAPIDAVERLKEHGGQQRGRCGVFARWDEPPSRASMLLARVAAGANQVHGRRVHFHPHACRRAQGRKPSYPASRMDAGMFPELLGARFACPQELICGVGGLHFLQD
ncbi:hypothetical protein AURDEDRAFT_175521 [Auricularia subglabra TFB-10046 SS5]|uniref:Uncharacterized protein n=1 Tax=Auricularia subglabra (strain TFB-10046 / SS5) TaxID=717982 RepID=J0WT68_AURST|nr:hypothetical protein AURDEDRAFT_175521 [Auricularia subglabra TFB-10046 SS5]